MCAKQSIRKKNNYDYDYVTEHIEARQAFIHCVAIEKVNQKAGIELKVLGSWPTMNIYIDLQN